MGINSFDEVRMILFDERRMILRRNGYQKKYWLVALLLIAIVFLFLPGCSKTDQGAAPKKGEAQSPAKVETPVKAPEPAKAEAPPKVQEPVKAQEPAKVQGDAIKPPKKATPKKPGAQEHNPDYDP